MDLKAQPEDFYAALVRQRNEALDRAANAEAQLAAARRVVADLCARLEASQRRSEAAGRQAAEAGCCAGRASHGPSQIAPDSQPSPDLASRET